MLYLDDIFDFLISNFAKIIDFVCELPINLSPELKINFGIFLVSCFIIGLCIRIIFNTFGFDNIFDSSAQKVAKDTIDEYNEDFQNRFWSKY